MYMIKLPKKRGLALTYNESHDYIRRIPTFRTKKQENRDSKIVGQIAHAWDVEGNPAKTLDIFIRKEKLLTNPVYWETLRTVWLACGNTLNAHLFRPYFMSKRGASSWFMTIEDAAALENMHFPMTLYRAYEFTPDPGISWTSDREWCEQYAKSMGRKVKSRTFNREDIYAYISRRGENEFLILK